MKDRASLIAELERRGESCDGTVKELKQKLEACLLEEQRIYQSQGKRADIVHLDQDIKPSTICVLSEHLLGCACDTSRKVYTIEVRSNGHFLSGTVTKFCDFTPLCGKVRSMCLSTDGYLVMAHNKGITKVKMTNQEVKEYAMADAGQASSGIQAVAPLSDGKVAFTDQTRRQVMHLDRNGTVTVIAGTGEEGNRNGSGSFAAFGQPMGLCTEGDNIFLTDAQIGTVKLVTTVTGTIQFLENLGQFYSAFFCTPQKQIDQKTHNRGGSRDGERCFCLHQIHCFECAGNSKFKQSNKWATGHSSIKNSKVCASCREGAQQTEVKRSRGQSYLQN